MDPTPTTPPRNTSSLLQSTPIHTQSSIMDRYSPNCEAQEDTFLQLSSEMGPYFVGPLPPEEFLNQFMCQPSGDLHLPHFREGMFSAMRKSSKE